MYKPRVLALALAWSSTNVLGFIVEISSINKARYYAFERSHTLVCIDIDDTLLKLKTPACPESRQQQILCKYAAKQGMAINELGFLEPFDGETECTEAGTVEFVHDLLQQKIPTLVLTARQPEAWPDTVRELSQAKIDFSSSIFGHMHQTFGVCSGTALLTRGILFAGSPCKFDALDAFLSTTDCRIERVVCIDDNLDVLNFLEANFTEWTNIDFVGLHYDVVEREEQRFFEVPQSFRDWIAQKIDEAGKQPKKILLI